ncbi:hypothetical protein OIU74_004602 [Salix koriyanagi]|uniref:VQ domain-containing protein n=1 Tax=Salix koriyanagi TaxID=2511006 RepID=A0A9Q0UMP9_9ROSI|nr:hypothetical protein OIU74_004602 [Salix koriyanagi]
MESFVDQISSFLIFFHKAIPLALDIFLKLARATALAMEAYNNSSTSLTSSSSMHSKQYSEETKGLKMPQSYHLSLHSIRKPQMKPGKKPIAPLPPTPPRVYKVDPINFRDLVQKLTGAPEPEPQHQPRLQSVAPPPLDLATPAVFSPETHSCFLLLRKPHCLPCTGS